MRTKTEIDSEIKELRALKPTGLHRFVTSSFIALQIEELEHGIDDTAGEWEEFIPSEKTLILETRAWKEGRSNDQPSKGWDGLVEARSAAKGGVKG